MDKYEDGDLPGEKVKRTKKYEPTDSDYEISNIGISEAENGVVIECRYQLKDSVKDSMRKKADGAHMSFYSYEYDHSEKHVFEDKKSALDFITSELNSMWSDGK